MLGLSDAGSAETESVDLVLVRWMKLIRQGKAKELFEEIDRNHLSNFRLPPPPLVEAAKVGNVEIILGLLERGARVDHRDGAGQTALHLAMRENNAEVVEILLKEGADPFAITYYFHSPLRLTIDHEMSKARERFLEHLRADGRLERILDWELAILKARSSPQELMTERAKFKRLIPEWGNR